MKKNLNPYQQCFGNVSSEVSVDQYDREDFCEVSLNDLGVLTKRECVTLPFELDGSAFDLDPKDPNKFARVDTPITMGSLEDQLSDIENYINSVKSQFEKLNDKSN